MLSSLQFSDEVSPRETSQSLNTTSSFSSSYSVLQFILCNYLFFSFLSKEKNFSFFLMFFFITPLSKRVPKCDIQSLSWGIQILVANDRMTTTKIINKCFICLYSRCHVHWLLAWNRMNCIYFSAQCHRLIIARQLILNDEYLFSSHWQTLY